MNTQKLFLQFVNVEKKSQYVLKYVLTSRDQLTSFLKKNVCKLKQERKCCFALAWQVQLSS